MPIWIKSKEYSFIHYSLFVISFVSDCRCGCSGSSVTCASQLLFGEGIATITALITQMIRENIIV
jgi:hypothetical protein